jgi:integrase
MVNTSGTGSVLPTSTEASLVESPVYTERFRAALAHAADLARSSMAPATKRAYKADWVHYADWCETVGVIPIPATPTTVGAYLASLEGKTPSTIRRRLAALGKVHRFNDLPWDPTHPRINAPLNGMLRQYGQPVKRAAPLTVDLLRQVVATCDLTTRGRRDRALLLIGFAGALRRSEIVRLRVEDVAEVAGGLKLRILWSKTDLYKQGAELALCTGLHVETCPVRAFRAWQEVAQRETGPLFSRISTGDQIGRSALAPNAVSRILARRLSMAGISMLDREKLSAHSLRSGFITEAYRHGVRDLDIMRHSRHKSIDAMHGYVRASLSIAESPAGFVGL